MKKSKFLKPFSFASLALLMGVAGTMAFAPLGATNPQLANANELIETTTEQGLITTHENDPTLYTTESGLDIKFGLATPNIEVSLATGNLQGFPYFTTTSGSTTYTWVIIGQATDKPLGTSTPAAFLFSSWTSLSDYYINKKYFSSNIKDTTTPAGSAINSITPSKSYVIDSSNFGNIKTNSEIPSGCVLVLANGNVATGTYNTSYSYKESAYRFGQYYGTNSNQKQAMADYYTNGSFGLSGVKSNIQSMTIKTYEFSWTTDDGNGWTWRTASTSAYLFPLCTTNLGNSTFAWATYLTANQMKLSTGQWARGDVVGYDPNVVTNRGYPIKSGGVNYYETTFINTSGVNTPAACNATYGYRPAFVLKIT